jgi:PAS domain S-box-containing protein
MQLDLFSRIGKAARTTGRRVDAYRLIWLVGIVLVAVMAAFQVYDVLRRRAIVLETTQSTYASLARSAAEQTRSVLLVAQLAVHETAREAGSSGWPASGAEQRLRGRSAVLPQVRALFLLAPDRTVLGETTARTPYDLARQVYRDINANMRDASAGAMSLQVHDGWTIALWESVEQPHKSPESVAVALVDLGYVAGGYASLRLGLGSELRLLDAAGQLLVRSSSQEAPARKMQMGDLESSRNVTIATHPLAGYPFSVVASVDNQKVLQPWNVQAMHSAVRTSLFCLSVLLLLALALRQLKRRGQAEADLRMQTALLDELFESAPEAIVMLDADQRVTRLNREFTRMFGFDARQACGRPLIELIVPDDLKGAARRTLSTVQEGRHTSMETVRMRNDGSRLHVSELGAPITAVRGSVASYAIYRDVTERRLAELERGKLESRLRQAEKLEAVGTMAGGIAHDFNSVITAILGYGEMARSEATESGALKRYVANVLAAADRAKALVDQILTYSRTPRARRDVINPRTVVLETLELVRASLPANVALNVQLSIGDAAVIADPTQLHQIVMNLCTNAVFAMPEGGSLSVALEAADIANEQALSQGALAPGRYVRLTVRDTGCGMESQVREHIFEPFFTTRKAGEGTGLGLALVHGIASELGGAIEVTSQPRAGSTFQVYLPRAEVAHVPGAAALPKGVGQQVLVVEDEASVMLLVEEMLAALGYEPAGFTRPAAALEEFHAAPTRFDAVVVDYLMPDMTGTDLVRQLRAVRAEIPVILVSRYEGMLLLKQAAAAGIDEIVSKPLELQQLAEAMARVLARPR